MATEEVLFDIAELREFEDYTEANEYLKLGWVLLCVRVEDDTGDSETPNQKTVYCLGWPKSLGGLKTPWESFT